LQCLGMKYGVVMYSMSICTKLMLILRQNKNIFESSPKNKL
jgi:hypothetical protein